MKVGSRPKILAPDEVAAKRPLKLNSLFRLRDTNRFYCSSNPDSHPVGGTRSDQLSTVGFGGLPNKGEAVTSLNLGIYAAD